jgi:hypothetical protein
MRSRLLALLLALAPLAARADVTLGLNGEGGPNTGMAGASLGVDLGASQAWNLSGTYQDTLVTKTASPSLTHAASLGLSYVEGAWDIKGDIDYSNDQVDFIAFAGPSICLGYTRTRRVMAAEGSEDDEDEPAPTREEAWRLALGADIHGYGVDLGANTRRLKLRQLTSSDELYITQFYPNLSFEAPLDHGLLTPSLTYGHYFYNKDPEVVAGLINKRYSTGIASSRVGSLNSGFYYDAVAAGLALRLPAGFGLSGSFGGDNLISPAGWNSLGSVTLAWTHGRMGLSAGWSDTVASGVASSDYLGAVNLRF